MNRRQIMIGGAGLLAFGVVGTRNSIVAAQSTSVIDEVLHEQIWQDIAILQKLRILASAFADIRIAYNGPFGYEASGQDGNSNWGVFAALELYFGGYMVDTILQRETVSNMLGNEDIRLSLESEMTCFLDQNIDQYDAWLNSLGIRSDARIRTDFLRAQATFSVFAASQIDGNRLSPIEEFTWIWPFC